MTYFQSKKSVWVLLVLALFSQPALSQNLKDKDFSFVSISLDQVLRLNVTSGGNVEFVFNSIDQYENGINSGGASVFYQTDIEVASSTRWYLEMGADGEIGRASCRERV